MTTVVASNSDCRPVTACLACESTRLHPVLDLGPQPLANNLVDQLSGTAPDERFPLGVQLCTACHLVQLTHTVKPERMFSTYRYVPSTSATWVDHCDELAEAVAAAASLRSGDLVVEIGSNDGTLLRAFQRRGYRVLGVDPAANIAAEATASGVPTVNYFFGRRVAELLAASYGTARAVVSTNVLAHVPNPVDLLRGVRTMLAPGAMYVNESPSLAELIGHNEFDTIYHEHVSYLSLDALVALFDRSGLRLVDAVPQSTHGGSLRVFGVLSSDPRAASARVHQLLATEQLTGIADPAQLGQFAQRVADMREQLRELIQQLQRDGRRVAAYGATAKGNTLLGYCGLTRRDVEYIVDRNPMKQGMLTPGLRIPIVSTAYLESDPPDVLLLLAWNIADEIRTQLDWFAKRGGQFLLPVPTPKLI